ncbi:MAG TPA: multicopper oxidase domain-containing protein, partial [Gemmatimonadota bacterium]|nr:multicopper oxidase domain-containing protein [Gemmatimonadota bacterium]
DLLPAGAVTGARGAVYLAPGRSPFGISVTADGTAVYDLAIAVDGLPDPASLGGDRYVAWAAAPPLSPVFRLGELGEGESAAEPVPVGAVALDKFLVVVTAEKSVPAGAEDPTRVGWRGPIVLRGTSPSMRLQPHELPALLAAGLASPPERNSPPAADHAHGASPGGDGWIAPPMHPDVPMIAGLDRLRPDASPWLPPDDPSAPEARPSEIVSLADGDTLDLVAGPVRRTIKGRSVMLYAFNGQIPGPMIRVSRGAEIVVRFANRLAMPASVHWHGIRLENRFDGVPGVTQEAVPPGGTYEYRIRFPDGGIYWYHPHHREDVLQDLGLYGNLLVDAPGAFRPVDREIAVVLDDILVADAGLVPWGEDAATHALMGRFGNVPLINGEPTWDLEVARGDVVRLYLTNVSNARTWNVSIPGVRMKLVATDVGRFEREEWVESVAIAPAERYVVEARFESPGAVPLLHRAHGIDMIYGNYVVEEDTLGFVRVADGAPAREREAGDDLDSLAGYADVVAEIDAVRARLDDPPERTLLLTVEVDSLPFPLGPILAQDRTYFPPLEWAGTMPEMNWATTGHRVRWSLVDPETGARDGDIGWSFRRGELVRLRLVSDRDAFHAMHHPIHVHGQRFLVTSVNGVPVENHAWKDTAIVPAGGAVDILVEFSNPGRWMVHCHVAEHLESGMQTVFTVE